MIEALITNMVSVIIAFLLILLIKGWFADVTGMPIITNIGLKNGIILIVLILTGILISSLYPALYLASFKPVDLFKGIKTSASNSFDLRKVLVVAQFTGSIFLLVGVLTVYKQINYMKKQDLGINIDRTIVTFSPPTMIGRPQRIPRLNSYRSNIKNIRGIESIATSGAIPGEEILWKRQDVRRPEDPPNTMKTYAYTYIDYDFINTFNLSLIAARNYTESENENGNAVIINETAVKQLGLKDIQKAIDSFILVGETQYKIVGVIKDFHQESLKKIIKPILFFYGYKWMSDIGYYSIKINSSDLEKTINQIEGTWKNIYPEDIFRYFFLDDNFNAQYQSDKAFSMIFSMFTGLAIFVAAIGLFGLALYTATQRTKEIGVRKVNGARNSEILILLNMSFIKLVIIAFVIATPIVWYVMHNWLKTFAYRTNLSWWIFFLAGSGALLIAVITITWQSWSTATRNPIKSLRYE
jgi:putative ABC transport system permease protein